MAPGDVPNGWPPEAVMQKNQKGAVNSRMAGKFRGVSTFQHTRLKQNQGQTSWIWLSGLDLLTHDCHEGRMLCLAALLFLPR